MVTSLTTEHPAAADDWLASAVPPLRSLAVRGLGRMYRPEQGLFAFRLHRTKDGDVLEGVSVRYSAIALIGLAGEDEALAAEILNDERPREVCSRLLGNVEQLDNLGDVALTLWAASALHLDNERTACDRLRDLLRGGEAHPIVEIAWALLALVVARTSHGVDQSLTHGIAGRLMASFACAAGVFPHWPPHSRRSGFRSHVACFADQVYPLQALARYHAWSGHAEAGAIARRCAQQICSLQGSEGQWWWHYDIRSGRVIEGYPVYSVHQDAMAPMALFAVRDACGVDYGSAVERGMRWLQQPAEISDSLIDEGAGVIWRKVARNEPGKFSRGAQALASRVHPALRVPGLARLLRPTLVDYECRPYHLGWLLHAWSDRDLSA